MDIFSHPVQDDYERAKDKARHLLKSILPEKSWEELEMKDVVTYQGKRGVYIISPYSQTEILDPNSGKCLAYACFQLTIPAPTYDRMVAEYILIKSDEKRYWKTANIFSQTSNAFGFAALFYFAVTDIALFVNLLRTLLTTR